MKTFRYIFPIIVVLTISLLAIGFVMYFVAGKVDEQAMEHEQKMLHSFLDEMKNTARAITEDNALWSYAVQKIVVEQDQE